MYVRNLFCLFCGGLCVQNVWIKSKLSNQQVLLFNLLSSLDKVEKMTSCQIKAEMTVWHVPPHATSR